MKNFFYKNKLDPEIFNYSFAPSAPNKWKKNINEWLNSDDLTKVMKLYEQQYSDFVFIGPSPIDFDHKLFYGKCVWEELCKFDLKKFLKKRKHKIGIIFNTDPHNKGGEHWVSSFIDLTHKPNPYFFYFDSNGDKVLKEVKVLADRIILQAKDLGITMDFFQNHPLEHQQGDTECGIYSLYMISEILTGKKTYNYFLKTIVSDKAMESLRDSFFDLN